MCAQVNIQVIVLRKKKKKKKKRPDLDIIFYIISPKTFP